LSKLLLSILVDILPKIYVPSQVSGRISGIRPLPDIRCIPKTVPEVVRDDVKQLFGSLSYMILTDLKHLLHIFGSYEARNDAGQPAPCLRLDKGLHIAKGILYKALPLK
jgi:hypothetical protein